MEQSLPSRLHRPSLILGGALALAVVTILLIGGRRDRVAGHAYAIPSTRGRIVVEVLNGTPRPGAARAGTRLLRRQGMDVVFFGNADTREDSTVVIARRGATNSAEAVAEALGVGRVAAAVDTLRRVDVTVILGEDFRPDQGIHP